MAFRWLVIGIGDITRRRVIPAIVDEPRSVLAALVTRDLAKAEAYAGVRAWTSLEEALAADHDQGGSSTRYTWPRPW